MSDTADPVVEVPSAGKVHGSDDESAPCCCDGTGAPGVAEGVSTSRHHYIPPHHPLRLARKRPKHDEQMRTCQVAPEPTRDEAKGRDESSSSTPPECSLCSPVPVPPLSSMARGERDLSGWQGKSSGGEVLGHLKDCMESLAEHCLRSVQECPHTGATLRVLSLSDGCVNDPRVVPSSVMLGRAFTSLGRGALPRHLHRVKICGANVDNPRPEHAGSPAQASWVPPWLEMQHVRLDNEMPFAPQIRQWGHTTAKDSQHKFDIIWMRQGLCYCKDHSFDCLPPEKLEVTGGDLVKASGIYNLAPQFRNGRPAYAKGGRFALYWRPYPRADWVIEEYGCEMGYDWSLIWANVVKDCGIPACAQAPWYVWNGKTKEYVIDRGVSCEVSGQWSSYGRHPPHACKCCGGIPLHAEAIEQFMGRVAAVLDEGQPKAFAFLHSGFYQGRREEVAAFYSELENAAKKFNSASTSTVATILRKQDGCDETTPYWGRIDGLLLSPRQE